MDNTNESFCNKRLDEHDTGFLEWILEIGRKFISDRLILNVIKEYQHRMLDMNDF